MSDEATTAEIKTTLAVFSTTLKRATEDLKEFSKELEITKMGVVQLTAAHDQCPFRKPEALEILQKKSSGNGNVNSWTPASITKLVAAVISGIGIAFAAIITALKWIAQ